MEQKCGTRSSPCLSDSVPLETPPMAAIKPHVHVYPHGSVEDPYHWLRNPIFPEPLVDQEIMDYLEEENAYTDSFFQPLSPRIKELTQEMRKRIKEDDASVPVRYDDYWYYHRYEVGQQYPVFYRRKEGDASEEVILDVPTAAADKSYFRLGAFSISPNHRYLAYAVDENGSERFTIKCVDLVTSSQAFETIPETIGSIVWSGDSRGFYYTPVNAQWRMHKVYYHRLGDTSQRDILIYEETDPSFNVSVGKSLSRALIFIVTHSHQTNEVLFFADAEGVHQPKVIIPRQFGIEYDVDHWGDDFVIRINDTGVNFRIISIPTVMFARKDEETLQNQYTELWSHDPDCFLTSVEAFKDFLVVTACEGGLPVVYALDAATHKRQKIQFPDAAYDVSVGQHKMYETDKLRLVYSSPKTPVTVFDYTVSKQTFETLKVQEIPTGFDGDRYTVERILAPTTDGKHVPITLFYKKDTPKEAPLVLHGYGSYGMSIPASFSSNRLSLVNRGIVFAIAHIRGGSELGRAWYEDGKFLNKKNTFSDFIESARYLIQQGYTREGQIAIWGGSAGGMLIGNVINQAPSLFKAALACVPFVDVLNTMMDDSLPLTPQEFQEWGNPQEKEYFDAIKRYSPYDHVKPQRYPHMLVTAGLNDPRVTYWEPAKWVARLRHAKAAVQDTNLLLLKTEMGQGHGGASGRFDALEEIAQQYAFILFCFGQCDET